MQVQVRIIQDTIVFTQKVEGMNGVQNIIERYYFEKIIAPNDTSINVYVTDTESPTIITLMQLRNGKLHIDFCKMNENNDAEVEYTGCNEWGDFSRIAEH